MKELKRKSFLVIGFMGSGKSYALKEIEDLKLKELEGFSYFDLDTELEKHLKTSITDWIKEHSWEEFRKKEEALLDELIEKNPVIISCGGGCIHSRNVMKFKAKSDLCYLEVGFEKCWERIKNDQNRPLVKLGKEFNRDLFNKRSLIYEQAEYKFLDEEKLLNFLVMISKIAS